MDQQGWRQDAADILLFCHLQPGARKTEFAGLHDGRIKIRINAPPVDGKANLLLITPLCDIIYTINCTF